MGIGGWRLDEALQAGQEKDVALVRGLLSEALWHVEYHEEGLAKAHNEVALMKALLARGQYTEFTYDEVSDDDSLDDDPPEDAISYVRYLVYQAKGGIEYHEKELRTAHLELAAVQALMQRCGLDFNLDELRAEDKARREKQEQA